MNDSVIATEQHVSIFERMSALARAHGALNLGQGKPEGGDPRQLIQFAAKAMRAGRNQYAPVGGIPELRQALAGWYAREQGLSASPEQFVVTCGATEALAASILEIVRPGDEVLVFEPAYDAYAPLIRSAGGKPVFVRLHPPHWEYRSEEIEAIVTGRTRAMILNNPHNPTGKVSSSGEIEMLAAICHKFGLYAICDEVWEAVRFDGSPHHPLMNKAGMAGRCVKIGSAGKIFGLTGWRVGWLCADESLANRIANKHQWLTFSAPAPFQLAVAQGLADPSIAKFRLDDWSRCRERLSHGLAKAGYSLLQGSATWFLCLDLGRSGIDIDDEYFCLRCVSEARVATIPLSAFISSNEKTSIIRISFCLHEKEIDIALERLSMFRDVIL